MDSKYVLPWANLARLCATRERSSETADCYRQVLGLADGAQATTDIATKAPILQAHLYLGNRAAAAAALATISGQLDAQGTNGLALFLVREQAHECHAIGLGLAFADLLAGDSMAGTLKPLELALRLLNGQEDPLLEQPAELQALAREIAAGWPAAYARRTSGSP